MLDEIMKMLNQLTDKELCILAVAVGVECAERSTKLKKDKENK